MLLYSNNVSLSVILYGSQLTRPLAFSVGKTGGQFNRTKCLPENVPENFAQYVKLKNIPLNRPEFLPKNWPEVFCPIELTPWSLRA